MNDQQTTPDLGKDLYGQIKPDLGTELYGSEEHTWAGFGRNILSSSGELLKNIGTAVSHPLETAKAVGQLALGAAEKVIPGQQDDEKNVDALVRMYADRYGGWDKLKETMYRDPIGVLTDLATVAGGAGVLARGLKVAAEAGGLARTAAAVGKVAELAGTTAEVTDPLRLAGKGAAAALEKTGLPGRLYESALKPSLGKKNLPKIAGQVATGLKEGLPVSEGGTEKLDSLVTDLQVAISDEISMKGAGKNIDPNQVANYVDRLRRTFADQVNPEVDLTALDEAKAEFLRKYEIKDAAGNVVGHRAIPAEEAQRVKIGTYQQLKDKYGKLSTATVEAQKALARGLKDKLVQEIPELADLNARESKLLDLEPMLTKAVARIRNHQLFGIGTPLAAAGAEAVTGSPRIAAGTAILRATLEQPQLKSRLAIALASRAARDPVKYGRLSYATALAKINTYVDSLANESAPVTVP